MNSDIEVFGASSDPPQSSQDDMPHDDGSHDTTSSNMTTTTTKITYSSCNDEDDVRIIDSDNENESQMGVIESGDDSNGDGDGRVNEGEQPGNIVNFSQQAQQSAQEQLSSQSSPTQNTPTQSNDAFSNPDENLEPVDRLEKYSISDITFHRQVVAKSVLETLQDVYDRENDVHRVIGVLRRLASDPEPSVRAELVEQIPHIALYCETQVQCMPNVVPLSVLPILEQFLTDTNSQVRKMTQGAFVMMLDQLLIKNDFLETQISPLLIQLTDFSNLDDYRIEAVGMMSKLVKYLGRESTEKLFIPAFTRLCGDVSFHVRRICAATFGDFCSIVSPSVAENVLIPQFRNLCCDAIWGVRKSCADVFVTVAVVVSHEIRADVLSPIFVNLLNDQSRWVKSAAFQALGPFISTFADPSKTGLFYSEGRVIVVEDQMSHDSGCGTDSPIVSPTDVVENENDLVSKKCYIEDDMNLLNLNNNESANPFNEFHYWRVPIDDFKMQPSQTDCDNKIVEKISQQSFETNIIVNQDLSSDQDCSTDIVKIDQHDQNESNVLIGDSNEATLLDVKTSESQPQSLSCSNTSKIMIQRNSSALTSLWCEDNTYVRPKVSLASLGFETSINSSEYGVDIRNLEPFGDYFDATQDLNRFNSSMHAQNAHVQNIIPNDLLENYLSMTNPIHYQNIDPDLTHHCAFSLPAVALTLGRKNWPCLRETYILLANEMQWKVRWTLASSLHQMSIILGSDYTTKDLLPIFMNFMKDLDEVRYGILQNLAAFLNLLEKPQQEGILPKICEFLKMDNNKNWRFRYTLGQQIILMNNLYSASQLKEFLLPIGMILLFDKVAQVRSVAIQVVSVLLKQLFYSENEICMEVKLDIIRKLNHELANSSKWVFRQVYVILCECLVKDKSLPYNTFMNEMMDHLCHLTYDQVANVRIALARTITLSLWPIAQFRSHSLLHESLSKLQSDEDDDVRKLANVIYISSNNKYCIYNSGELNESNDDV